MARSEDRSDEEEVTGSTMKLKLKSKSKPPSKSKPSSKSNQSKSKPPSKSNQSKSKAEKPKKSEDKNDSEDKSSVGGAWIHSHTLYVIDQYKHQIELGKGNDGGLKHEAWTQVLENYHKKFDLDISLSRLKNHFQKLKSTFKAFDRIIDSSGAPGTDTVTGEVHAKKEWWDHWINEAGQQDAKPIRKGGFPAYQAVATIMPEKHLRANGNEGSGTQSKKKKAAPPSSVESDKDEEGHIQSDNNDSNKNEEQSNVSNSHKDSDLEEIEGNPVASSQKKKPASRKKPRNDGLTAAEAALDDSDSDEDETPEARFVRSRRSPIGSTSTAKRTRTSGPKLVAESISKAVDRMTGMTDKHESDKVIIAKIKSEQHPMRQEAMAIFNKECAKNLKPQHIIKAANELKKDDNASFFYYMDKAYRWDWLKEEADVLQEYQEVRENGEED